MKKYTAKECICWNKYPKSVDIRQANIRLGKEQKKSMSMIRLLRLNMIEGSDSE